jgi:hypothetical protein
MSELHPTHAPAGADRPRHDEESQRARPAVPDGFTDAFANSSTDSFDFDPDHPVLVSIRWKDAESQGGPTWEDTDEMLEFARRPLTIVLTVGVLLHMDTEQVAVTDTVAADQMGGVTKIPRGWIERIEVLGPASPNGMADVTGRPNDRETPPARRVG